MVRPLFYSLFILIPSILRQRERLITQSYHLRVRVNPLLRETFVKIFSPFFFSPSILLGALYFLGHQKIILFISPFFSIPAILRQQTNKAMTADIQKKVVDKILEALDSGVAPWQKGWTLNGFLPMNYVSKKPYNGINFFMCMANNFTSPYYLSKKQINDAGGSIIKGCKGTLITYWTMFKKLEKDANGQEKERLIPYLQYSYVWNEEQISGIEFKHPEKGSIFSYIEEADRIIDAMPNKPMIKEAINDKAYYSPTFDYIALPSRAQYADLNKFYSTLNHELIHSTGHKSRVGRAGIENFDYAGSHQYAFEELIAELGACMLNSISGVNSPSLTENNAAYIKHWRDKIASDNKLIFKAATEAQKAVDYILGVTKESAEVAEKESA